jgi:hypothetical protein
MSEDNEKTYIELHKKVSQFIKPTSSNGLFSENSNDPKSYFNSKIILYALPPTVLLVLFITMKPTFIMSDVIVDGNVVDTKINITKTFGITLVISLAIILFFKYKM